MASLEFLLPHPGSGALPPSGRHHRANPCAQLHMTSIITDIVLSVLIRVTSPEAWSVSQTVIDSHLTAPTAELLDAVMATNIHVSNSYLDYTPVYLRKAVSRKSSGYSLFFLVWACDFNKQTSTKRGYKAALLSSGPTLLPLQLLKVQTSPWAPSLFPSLPSFPFEHRGNI